MIESTVAVVAVITIMTLIDNIRLRLNIKKLQKLNVFTLKAAARYFEAHIEFIKALEDAKDVTDWYGFIVTRINRSNKALSKAMKELEKEI